MDGQVAEKALLGAVLQDNRLWRSVADVVSGNDFLDPRLGQVFDGIGLVLASGGSVSSVDIWTFYADWGVRGFDVASAHEWVMACEAPFRALGYANAVRVASGRVRTKNALEAGLAMLEDVSVASDDVALRVVNDLRAKDSSKSLETASLADLDKLEEKHDWVVPGLFERQDRLIVTGFEGSGKALALDTKLPTPSGWTTMGDVQVGDMLIDADGLPTKVVAVSDVMHDRDVYEVVFNDGTVIVADGEHQWVTEDYAARMTASRYARKGDLKARGTNQRWKRKHFPKVVTTKEISETVHARGGHTLNHSIDVFPGMQLPAKSFVVDPYVLGVWLGDGTSASGGFTTADEECVSFIEAAGYDVLKRKGQYSYTISKDAEGVPLMTSLREIGVLGNKHIPKEYLRGSYEQRLALLQGLMDSDGSVSDSSGSGRGSGAAFCEFSSKWEHLAEQVAELATSLGLRVSIARNDAQLNGRIVGDRFRVTFQTDKPVFRLSRKLARIVPLRTLRSQRRMVKSVMRVESVPVKCVQVDNAKKLYLAGESMIVTHNSTLMRQLLILPAAGLHPLTFEAIEPVKCLAIDAENTAMQWKRQAGWIRHLANKNGSVDPGLNVHIATAGRVNILDPRILGNIHRLIDEHNPSIVFIGPLYRLAVKMNNDDDVAPVIAALDTIRDRGVVLLMEAHAGHAQNSSGVRDVRPRGSSALMGWPEFGFGLRIDSGTVGTSSVEYDFVPWRGMREERGFPEKFRRGVKGEFPWIVLE